MPTAARTAADPVRRCAVLGSPIAHSLSPVLHRRAYDELGLAWTYEALLVEEAGLAAFLDGLDGRDGRDTRDGGWRGLSLTMPLKRAVVPLLDGLSERAAQAGAANTVVLEAGVDGGPRGRRVGHNTDVPGIAAALRERWDGPVRRAVVLGGGATAASAVLGLADLGCELVTLLVRDPARAEETRAVAARHPAAPRVDVARLGDVVPDADVLVSTVPAAAQTPEVLTAVGRAPVVFEVVYDPWPTPLARWAGELGAVLVTGLDLLVHQAALQVELMTGAHPAPLEAMRRAGRDALAARA